MTATLCRTPSQWLLARYDREARRVTFGPPPRDWRHTRSDRGQNCDRPLFEVLDDHVDGDDCGFCFRSASSTWSSASTAAADLADELAVA